MKFVVKAFRMADESWPEQARARLRAAIQRSGKTQAAIAQEAGMSASNLSNLLANSSEPGAGKLQRIAAAVGVTVDYILTGEKPQRLDAFAIPIADGITASAGYGALPNGDGAANQRVLFPTAWMRKEFGDPANLELIQVRGDSMGPEFPDGSWVMFDRSRRGPATGTYVINLEGAVCIKDVQFRSIDVMVMSRHAGYESHIVSASEAADPAIFEVLGRVVWAGTQLV